MNIDSFDSQEELYFWWWASELLELGIITQIKYQPKSFELFNGADVKYLELMKTKTKQRSVKLLGDHKYTADWLIFWNMNVHRYLFVGHQEVLNDSFKNYPFVANYSEAKKAFFSVIDVKGTFNQNDAWRRFSIDQKWVFQTTGIYVQKIITHPAFPKGKMTPANALFPNTFIPRRFQTTDKGKMKRKIKYPTIFSNEYLKRHGL